MKYALLLFLMLFYTLKITASEGPEGEIVDELLGQTKTQLFIYQYVFEYDGTNNPAASERYLVIKSVRDNQLIVDRQIRLSSDAQILDYINIPDFEFSWPYLVQSKYLILSQTDGVTLEYFGRTFNLKSALPKDLRSYKIDKVECVYEWNEHIFVVVDLVNNGEWEQLRKLVMLK